VKEDGINEEEMFKMIRVELEVRREEKAEKALTQ